MKQRGFTLIELIIVIIILGILAVTAAPRFFDFGGDARASSVQGVAGAINGSMQTVYARAAIDGELGAGGEVQGISTEFGYPAASAGGIIDAAQLNAEELASGAYTPSAEWIFAVDDSGSEDIIYITLASILSGDTLDDTDESDITDTNCYVSYQETANTNNPPTVSVTTTGC